MTSLFLGLPWSSHSADLQHHKMKAEAWVKARRARCSFASQTCSCSEHQQSFLEQVSPCRTQVDSDAWASISFCVALHPSQA